MRPEPRTAREFPELENLPVKLATAQSSPAIAGAWLLVGSAFLHPQRTQNTSDLLGGLKREQIEIILNFSRRVV